MCKLSGHERGSGSGPMCHALGAVSQKPEPGKACIPVWNPASGELTFNRVEPKPGVFPVSATPTGRLAAMVFCCLRVPAGGTTGQRAVLSPGNAGAIAGGRPAAAATAPSLGKGHGARQAHTGGVGHWQTQTGTASAPHVGEGCGTCGLTMLPAPAGPSPFPCPPTGACSAPGQAGPRAPAYRAQQVLLLSRSLGLAQQPEPLATNNPPGKERAKAGSISTYSTFQGCPHNPLHSRSRWEGLSLHPITSLVLGTNAKCFLLAKSCAHCLDFCGDGACMCSLQSLSILPRFRGCGPPLHYKIM